VYWKYFYLIFLTESNQKNMCIFCASVHLRTCSWLGRREMDLNSLLVYVRRPIQPNSSVCLLSTSALNVKTAILCSEVWKLWCNMHLLTFSMSVHKYALLLLEHRSQHQELLITTVPFVPNQYQGITITPLQLSRSDLAIIYSSVLLVRPGRQRTICLKTGKAMNRG